MNFATFAGRIGRDAETRATASGKEVTGYSVAVDVGFGERKRTLWVDCSHWGDRGTKLARFLTKGTSVTVGGEVDLQTYKDKSGTEKTKLVLSVQSITLQGGGERQQAPAQTAKLVDGNPFADEEIPF